MGDENDAVIALILDEALEHELQAALNARPPRALVAGAEYGREKVRRHLQPGLIVVIDQVAGDMHDVGDAMPEEER